MVGSFKLYLEANNLICFLPVSMAVTLCGCISSWKLHLNLMNVHVIQPCMRNQLGSDGDFLYARSTSRESLKNLWWWFSLCQINQQRKSQKFVMVIFSMPDQPAEKLSKVLWQIQSADILNPADFLHPVEILNPVRRHLEFGDGIFHFKEGSSLLWNLDHIFA